MKRLSRASLLTATELAASRQTDAPVRQLALVWEVLSALGGVASAGLYARYQSWPALVMLGMALCCSLLCRISRRLSLAGRGNSAGALLLFAGIAVPIATTAFVSDLAPLFAVLAFLLPIGTAALVWSRRAFPVTLYAAAAGTALCILLDRFWPWDRLGVTDLAIYLVPIVALAAAGFAALLWTVARMPPGSNLSTRLVTSFLLIGAIPALVTWAIVTTLRWPVEHQVLPGVGQRAPGATGLGSAIWAWMAVLGLGSVAFSVALAFRVAARVADPFRMLVRRARKLYPDGMSSPTVRCSDEAEELSRALDATRLRQQALERAMEQALSSRTAELEQRCRHAEAAAEVAEAALRLLDERRFCQAFVEVMRERLGLQYAGLYVVAGDQPCAELHADSACAGWRGQGQPSRVRLGEGLVGRSIARAELVVDGAETAGAADVSESVGGVAVSAALPLRARGQVLGAVIVHGDPRAGFGKELLDALQAIVHLAALALDNMRVHEQSQEALAVAERAAGRLSLEAWAEIARTPTELGFRGTERGVERAKGSWHPRMLSAARDNAAVLSERGLDGGEGQYLTVPIRVRGEVIGILDTRKPAGDGVWTTDQVTLVEEITEQLSQALENARLYEETQRRGVRERQLREIGTRIGSGVDLDTILQTAIQDVANALGVPAAFVQLYEGGPDDGLSAG